MRKWIIHRRRDVATNSDGLYLFRHDDTSRTIDIVQPFVFETFPEYSGFPDNPIISGRVWTNESEVTTFLQAMMDAAFEAGLRPTGHRDMLEEMKAVRYHLEDMRRLAGFGKDGDPSH